MPTERPIDRRAAEALLHQIKAAIASGAPESTVDLAGLNFLVTKVRDGEYIMHRPGQSEGTTIFASAGIRPPSYPAELPFIPGEMVGVTGTGRTQALTWWAPSDPSSLVATLDRQLVAEGWEPGGEMRLAVFRTTQRAYARGNTQLVIATSGTTVSLSQMLGPDADYGQEPPRP